MTQSKITEDQAALAIAEASNCGLGSTGPDGKWCRILCDNEELAPGERFDRCECRAGAQAVLALVYAHGEHVAGDKK